MLIFLRCFSVEMGLCPTARTVIPMAAKRDRRSSSISVAQNRRTGRDRRKYPRVFVDLEVDYRCEDTFLFAYITDISQMGIFIRTYDPAPVGTHLNLRFSPLGIDAPLELEGTVTWINPYRPGNRENLNPGMGVRFVNLNEENKDRITHLIRTIAYLDEKIEGDDDIPPDSHPHKITGKPGAQA